MWYEYFNPIDMPHILVLYFFFSWVVFANDHTSPAGIMQDHIHNKGEFMPMYSIGYSNMKSNYNSSQNEVLSQYNNSPINMQMYMYMLGGMYGITDNFNISVMAHYMQMQMNNITTAGNMSHKSYGIGDTKISGLYKVMEKNSHNIIANFGVSLPTGSVEKAYQHTMGMMTMTHTAPYSMQMGTGSYSILSGITYNFLTDTYQFGGQFNGDIKIGNNKKDYRFGNVYNITLWATRNLFTRFAPSIRLNYTDTQNIHGEDSSLNISSSPAANNGIQHRKQLDFLIGMNYILPNGMLANGKILLEIGMPVYQKTGNGMLKNHYTAMLGFQQVF